MLSFSKEFAANATFYFRIVRINPGEVRRDWFFELTNKDLIAFRCMSLIVIALVVIDCH